MYLKSIHSAHFTFQKMDSLAFHNNETTSSLKWTIKKAQNCKTGKQSKVKASGRKLKKSVKSRLWPVFLFFFSEMVRRKKWPKWQITFEMVHRGKKSQWYLDTWMASFVINWTVEKSLRKQKRISLCTFAFGWRGGKVNEIVALLDSLMQVDCCFWQVCHYCNWQ